MEAISKKVAGTFRLPGGTLQEVSLGRSPQAQEIPLGKWGLT